MSSGRSLSRSLLKLPLSVLVKGTAIPSNPIEDHSIDINKPIIYALPYRSAVDLLSVQKQVMALGLPDPLQPLVINGKSFSRYVFTSSRDTVIGCDSDVPTESIALFSELLALHEEDTELDVQVIPVTVLWGRKPGKEDKHSNYLQSLNGPQKAKAVLLAGRDCLIRISPVVSLRYMANSHGTDSSIAHKLARVARIHFSRQKLAASGPNLPSRQALFSRLMKSKAIEKAIEDEANEKGIL